MLRVTHLNMPVDYIMLKLSDGHPGAVKVISEIMSHEFGFMQVLLLDTKHLYGNRIWELYSNVCGGDLERFKYHLDIELPCQVCGELAITGPYAARLRGEDYDAFLQARRDKKPGSFWALKDPPKDPNYAYPLFAVTRNGVPGDANSHRKVKG